MAFPSVAEINSERLVIRPVRRADLSDLLGVNGDEEVTRFLPYPTWLSLGDGSAWLGRMEALAASGTGKQLAIQRTLDGRIIGTLLLFKFDEPSARLEVGYLLGRAHWRQGFAKEALAAVCRHVFREMGIRRVEAEVNPDNTASNALLRSLGFTLEGRLRRRWVAKGVAYDTNVYGCLAEEWPLDKAAA